MDYTLGNCQGSETNIPDMIFRIVGTTPLAIARGLKLLAFDFFRIKNWTTPLAIARGLKP